MYGRFASVSIITIFVVSLSFGGIVLGNNLTLFSNNDEIKFEITVDNNLGINEYSLIEIDEEIMTKKHRSLRFYMNLISRVQEVKQ